MYALALAALAVLLIAVAPRVMAHRTEFRRAPLAALVAWQAVALAGVLSALAAAPIAVVELSPQATGIRPAADIVAIVVSGLVLAFLLVNGHLVGTRLRTARRRHRELLDLVGREAAAANGEVRYRVVPHETPTAYCIPGLRGRVVLTDGTLNNLAEDELAAVLVHERAHLSQRHDLVLELFSVLHRAAPPPIRAPQALREVKLLIEVLADRAARRRVGEVPLARALVALADGATPAATLGARGQARDLTPRTQPGYPATRPVRRGRGGHATKARVHTSSTVTRMRLLNQSPPSRWLTAPMYAFSACVLAAPIAVVVLALVG